jgi:hypothetical protein
MKKWLELRSETSELELVFKVARKNARRVVLMFCLCCVSCAIGISENVCEMRMAAEHLNMILPENAKKSYKCRLANLIDKEKDCAIGYINI